MNQVKPELLDEPLWLQVARKEIGVREGRDDKRIVAYHQTTRLKAGNSKVPWCAAFLGWCLEQAGLPNPRTARAADYAKYGRETYLEPGAIVVFDKSDPDAGGSGHVAFLVGVEGDELVVLGGNQRNSVCIAKRPGKLLAAVRWPVTG